MDAISDPLIREVWVMKAAQVGWTEILNNVIGYHVDREPAPMLLVQPTLEMAEAWSKDRLAPMIRDTRVLHDKIADVKSRDSGNTLLHKRFPGGHLTIAGANSPSGLASRPIRVVMFDEVDRFPSSAGTEGDPISLGKKRAVTFRNRRIMAGSTPTIKGSSRIEAGFEHSDQRFYFVPCPHCGEFQRLVWSQLRFENSDPDTAHYVCEHCGVVLTDADKPGMLREGEWRATRPSTGIAGFHLSELYSPWVSWPEMVQSFLAAKRLPETMQTWINTALGETWEDKGETVEATGLMARRENYTPQTLPPGVLLLTFGTDVQDDRLEMAVWAWGRDEEAWRVEYHVLRGDPGQAALWAEHDALIRRRYRTDDGRELVLEAGCVDSGGHFTEHVYRYCAARKRFRVWAIKGVSGAGRLVWPRRPTRGGKRSDAILFPIGVDTIKDVLYGRLRKIHDPGPGYVHFDAAADEVYFDQLTSETVVSHYFKGRRVRLWKPRAQGIKQEGLDTTVYAYAAMVGRGGRDLLAHRKGAPVEEPEPAEPVPEEPPPDPFRQAPKPVPPVRRSTNWVNRWR